MNLNERAAKAMDLVVKHDGLGSRPRYYHPGTDKVICEVANWCPAIKTQWPHAGDDGDYNQARILYKRVVEQGLKDELILEIEERLAGSNLELGASDGCLLDVEADLLTEACCTVLEQHEESN